MNPATTIVVGFDAACWEYLEPLLEKGKMPCLSSLIKSGVKGSLLSTMSPITPVAWSSIITGVNPGKHGVFEWVKPKINTYDFSPVSGRDRAGTPLWARLNQAGLRAGVVNIPLTYPPEPLDGFMLCGFGTPQNAAKLAYPEDIMNKIEAEFGHYEPGSDVEKSTQSSEEERYSTMRDHQKRVIEIAGYLARTQNIQVLFINLMLLDHSNHTLQAMNLVDQAMVETDEHLSWLINEIEPDNVMVISDHGSRRVKGVFLLGAWLAEHGWLTRQKRPKNDRINVINFLLHEQLGNRTSIWERLIRKTICSGLKLMPNSIIEFFSRFLDRSIPLASLQVNTTNSVLASESQAYVCGSQRAHINLNMALRDPEGTVLDTDREILLGELIRELSAIQQPDGGGRLFDSIFRSEELYGGPYSRNAPDLIADYYQSEWSIRSKIPGLPKRSMRYFVNSNSWYGDHSKEGIFVFSGNNFKHDLEHHNANLLDIPATLLHLYDVPQPKDYDGEPLTGLMSNLTHSIRFQPGDHRKFRGAAIEYSTDEEEQVRQRLQDLGYL